MADRRFLADLTDYTGRRARDERTVRVGSRDVGFKLLLTVVAGLVPAGVFGLVWAPLLGLWSLIPGLLFEVGWVFVLYWISPVGLRQRQWRKWAAKAQAANNQILHTGQIINQRFDQVRRMEPSILAHPRPPAAGRGLAHTFGRVRDHTPATTVRLRLARLRPRRRRSGQPGLPVMDRTPPDLSTAGPWTGRLPTTPGRSRI